MRKKPKKSPSEKGGIHLASSADGSGVLSGRITNCTFRGDGTGIRVDGDRHDLQLENLNFSSTNAIDVDGKSTISAKAIAHNPAKQEIQKEPKPARKYFGGFSFSKGDHLKK